MRHLSRAVVIGLVVLACGPVAGSPGASTTSPGSPSPPPASASAEPSGAASPPPASQPASEGPSGGLAPEMVAEVVTDDLRVRTAPGVADDSIVMEPLLQPGTMVYVVDGPVGASGYSWYEILTFNVELSLPGDEVEEPVFEHGWVAAADTTGEVWLAPHDRDCPPPPSDVVGLIALDLVTALACFGGEPLTITARIFDCQADPETAFGCGPDTGGPSFTPDWFDFTFRSLVPVDGPIQEASMYPLHADPLGTYPDPVPIDTPVQVTGQFNHPAASACTISHYVKDNVPTVYCRTIFAVTEIAGP